MSGEYEQYDAGELPWELRELPDGEDLSQASEDGIHWAPKDGGWCVIIEYLIDADGARSRTAVLDDGLDTRGQAVKAARRHAFEFKTPHPLLPQHRQVFETADGFQVLVHGAMTDYPFRLRVARFVGVRVHA